MEVMLYLEKEVLCCNFLRLNKKDAHDMSVCVNCFMAQQPSFSSHSSLFSLMYHLPLI